MTDENTAVTPVMAQYFEAKKAAPEGLLFFRLGDFYELFFDDALTAAEVLRLTLTKRGRHNGVEVPMCGVPARQLEVYAGRLLREGFKVAVCDQVETAEQASGGIIKRELTRLLTPGTVIEEDWLDPTSRVYLAAAVGVGDQAAVALLDVADGEVLTAVIERAQWPSLAAAHNVREVVLPDKNAYDDPTLAAVRSVRPAADFTKAAGLERLQRVYGVDPAGLGFFSDGELAALGGVLAYLQLTHRGRLPRLRHPVRLDEAQTLRIDEASRRNLELMQSVTGESAGSLRQAIDTTVTAAGSRLLARYLAEPLCRRAAIEARLDAVGHLAASAPLRSEVRKLLKGMPDTVRALARITAGNATPRDAAAVRDAGPRLRALHTTLLRSEPPPRLREAAATLALPCEAFRHAALALADPVPASFAAGGVIRQHFDDALDSLRATGNTATQQLMQLEAEYRALTGIASLKIKHNHSLGYYVETTAQAGKKLHNHDVLQHRRSTINHMCFTTEAITQLEQKLLNASDAAAQRERELVEALCEVIRREAADIAAMGEAAAELDVLASLADVAAERGYVRPELSDAPVFEVRGGRHPALEQLLRRERRGAFVANDCSFSGGTTLFLVTGPNTGGKSTYLRQNALMIVLAQIGSFVPAASAKLGIFTRLFCRAGAADDQARGRSTFAMEMIEAALILNQADAQTFVIIDELGRGTATYDGMALARAAVEHLVRVNRCLTLFATHYHELTVLPQSLPAVACLSVQAQVHKGELICLHTVVPGAEGRSYGLLAARKAGLPASVVQRAQALLDVYEAQARPLDPDLTALPLFAEGL